MENLKVGVIGLGVGARHASAFERYRNCTVAALCDRDETKLEGLKRYYPGAVLTTEARNILEDPDIRVVSIASYDQDHFDQAFAALYRGKHVFVEKPLCLKPEQAGLLYQLLNERPGLVLSGHFPMRSTPRLLELIDQAQRGKYGRIYLVSAMYSYGRVEKIIDGWRAAVPGYSIVLGGAIHLIDLLRQIVGCKVKKVSAIGNKIATARTAFKYADCVTSLLEYENEVVATVTANFGNMSPHHHVVQVYGTEGTFDHGLRGAWRYTSRDPAVAGEEIATPYRQERQGDTTHLIHSFVDAIIDGTSPVVNATEIFEAMAVCFAIIKAQETGKWVEVEYFD